jgi:epoxyqueuosine reductase
MEKILDILQSEFNTINAKFKTITITHLPEVQTELITWLHDGLISKKFYEQNYGQFIFHPPSTLPDARSIVLIGIPQKITRIEFFHNNMRHETIIPPTYRFSEIRATCKEILTKVLGSKGYTVERAILPMKLLAVKSGLGKYGRNNICYVDGMGSYTRLEAFYTNYSFPADDWGEPQLMKACASCSLCRQACPTHCIPNGRILIHADQCLTYFNENLGDFPASVPSDSHNALIGCMHCQTVCPQNKNYFGFNPEIITFTEEETTSLLQNIPRENIPESLKKKLKNLDMYEDYPELPRNLRVLLRK